MSSQQSKRRGSRYRQVRLTYTEELGGACSFSIAVKGLGDAWDEHAVIIRDHVVFAEPCTDQQGVFERLELIAAQLRWMPPPDRG